MHQYVNSGEPEVAAMSIDLNDTHVREWMAAALPAITPRTTIGTALRLLREHRATALPVLENARFVGLVDEKSLLRFTPSEATTLDVYELRDVLDRMTVARATAPAAATVTPDTPLSTAAATMRLACAQVLPVMEGDRLVGLLPWTRLLAAASGDAPGADLATIVAGRAPVVS
ncbi:MAG TPA: CBS domain-containing protein [bacterium]|nr:CBS domain-containing protein [bacterium]